jgi:plasmid maintenance system antidote protein VapI
MPWKTLYLYVHAAFPALVRCQTIGRDRIRQSDYALAKRLDVLPQTISNYRKGRTQMSDEIAVAMAALIDRVPAPILAQLAADRAKSPEVAKIWKDAAKALARMGRGGK